MIDLKTILNKYPQTLTNITIFRGILKDLYPDSKYKPEIYLLIKSYEIGIIEEIQKNKLDNLFLKRISKKLIDEYSVSADRAKQIVHLWCEAYGVGILNKKITYSQQNMPIPNNSSQKHKINIPLIQNPAFNGYKNIIKMIMLIVVCLALGVFIGLKSKKTINTRDIGEISYELCKGSSASISEILTSQHMEYVFQNSVGKWEINLSSKEDNIVSFPQKSKAYNAEQINTEIKGEDIGVANINLLLKNIQSNNVYEYSGKISITVKRTKEEQVAVDETLQKLNGYLSEAQEELLKAQSDSDVDHNHFVFEEETLADTITQFTDKIENIQKDSDISEVQQYYDEQVHPALEHFLIAYNKAIEIANTQNDRDTPAQVKASPSKDNSASKKTAVPKKQVPNNNISADSSQQNIDRNSDTAPKIQKTSEPHESRSKEVTQNSVQKADEKKSENKTPSNVPKSSKIAEIPIDQGQAPPDAVARFD